MLRNFFISLSASEAARSFVTHFSPARRSALRFVAGETMDEALAVVKTLNQQGIKALLNEVGESVTTQAEVSEAATVFHDLLACIKAEQADATISIKPSHVGLGFGEDFCYETIADIVAQARKLDIMVEIDMEGSPDVEATLRIFHRLLDTFGGGLRLAVQTYLHRTLDDLRPIVARGSSARLVKGAYQEPAEIAYQDREEIRQASIEAMKLFLTPEARTEGAYLALGSHDPVLIEWLIAEAQRLNLGKDEFEFQMLLGVRRDEQQRLANLGYRVRVYVPFGSAWYPYFMRRLAERPANVLFMARAFFGK